MEKGRVEGVVQGHVGKDTFSSHLNDASFYAGCLKRSLRRARGQAPTKEAHRVVKQLEGTAKSMKQVVEGGVK